MRSDFAGHHRFTPAMRRIGLVRRAGVERHLHTM
jgi:hypothetical protein